MGKMIKGIPCSRLWISSLPGSASRTHVESGSLTSDSIQQAFSRLCLVYLISKDTHIIFSIYLGARDDLKPIITTA